MTRMGRLPKSPRSRDIGNPKPFTTEDTKEHRGKQGEKSKRHCAEALNPLRKANFKSQKFKTKFKRKLPIFLGCPCCYAAAYASNVAMLPMLLCDVMLPCLLRSGPALPVPGGHARRSW